MNEVSKPNCLFVIMRTPPKKRISETYTTYTDKRNQRRRNNQKQYDMIDKVIRSYQELYRFPNILKLAQALAEKQELHIDRNAKRVREELICWFCENWDKVKDLVQYTYDDIFGKK